MHTSSWYHWLAALLDLWHNCGGDLVDLSRTKDLLFLGGQVSVKGVQYSQLQY